MSLNDSTAVILCGGSGIILDTDTGRIPKALIPLGDRALVWHVMKRFYLFGIKKFVLACGYGNNAIRDYFIDFSKYNLDIAFDQKNNTIKYYGQGEERDWEINFINTGIEASTGARIARLKDYLKDEEAFFVAYSDCISNINIQNLYDNFHSNSVTACITGVKPIYRYGEFICNDSEVIDYDSMSQISSEKGWINGGYMVLSNKIFDYINVNKECCLEKEVLKQLVKDKELKLYKHHDFWYAVDHQRDINYLNELWHKNNMVWLKA
jgi:glucose-1-phosphate cytidylyltransferase